jgi:hypothetical protein
MPDAGNPDSSEETSSPLIPPSTTTWRFPELGLENRLSNSRQLETKCRAKQMIDAAARIVARVEGE